VLLDNIYLIVNIFFISGVFLYITFCELEEQIIYYVFFSYPIFNCNLIIIDFTFTTFNFLVDYDNKN